MMRLLEHRSRGLLYTAAVVITSLFLGACADDRPPPPPPLGGHCWPPNFFFDFGSADLTEQTRKSLSEIVKPPKGSAVCVLDPRPSSKRRFFVVGHTDKAGSEAANDYLAMRRAQNIARQMIELGIPREHICVRSRGSKAQLVIHPGREPQNRRVEVNHEIIQDPATPCPAAFVAPDPF